LFPGVISELTMVGSGRTHCMKGSCVLTVGKHFGNYQDGLIDMSGPGAKHTIHSRLVKRTGKMIELPHMSQVIGELESLACDGLSGVWKDSVKEDGLIIIESSVLFCSDGI